MLMDKLCEKLYPLARTPAGNRLGPMLVKMAPAPPVLPRASGSTTHREAVLPRAAHSNAGGARAVSTA